MFGQVRIEFVFSVVIFALIIFFIVTQTNVLFSSLLTDSRSDTLKARASTAIKILVEDGGDPPTWDINVTQGHPEAVKRVGLAYIKTFNQPYSLSKNKIDALNSNCSSTSDYYRNLLWNFGLNAYVLEIYNSTDNQILVCGSSGGLEPPLVTETRYIFIDNGYGKITLGLW